MTQIEMELHAIEQHYNAIGTAIQNIKKQLVPKAKKEKALKPEHQAALDKAIQRHNRNATKPRK